MAQRFGRYWLHEKIGHGGMAEIFRATIGPDPDTYAFELAIKRLHSHLQRDKTQVDMFLTEADVAKFLRHPNIVQVYEAGIVDGQTYIAMEYVWGTDLATLIDTLRKRRLRFPPELTVWVGLQVLRALDYVHRATAPGGEAMEIVHRDVTPSNIYVTFDGQVKLGDFGIARVSFLEERDDPVLKGKVAYMPPEVLAGEPVDQRLDLWSLSVTLWEMLTTRRLYEDVAEDDILSGSVRPRIAPVHSLNSDVPKALSKILQRALSPKASRRPQDAVDLYRELKLYLRDHGLVVEGSALARFVNAVIGGQPAAAESRVSRAPSTGIFEKPAYQVPLGMSPTQRFELVRPHRSSAMLALLALVAVAVAGTVGVILWQRRAVRTPSSKASMSRPLEDGKTTPSRGSAATGVGRTSQPGAAAPHPTPAATVGSDDEAPRAERPRPVVPDELNIEFADGTAEPEPSAGAGTDARFEAFLQRARGHVKKRRYAAADTAFREALALEPKSVPALLGRANVLLELRRYAEAEQLVRSALSVTGDNARAFLLLGDILWVQGRDKAARQAYERCIELDPDGAPARTAKRILANL